MRRGLLTCELTTPKVDAPKLVLGGPNCGWLKRLKNSVRNSNPALSVIMVRLKTAKSKLETPFMRSVGSTRASSPKLHGPGATKHAVLNHSPNFDSALPDMPVWHPETTSGRRFCTPRLALFSAELPP